MSYLHRSTLRRLQQLPQVPSVWEGDRCPLSALGEMPALDDNTSGECIIWIDGIEGVVRGMEFIPSAAGHEGMVRSLLQAMENPQSPAKPARPQKIIVRSKEVHFYLRGVLQELDIQVESSSELPLVDELIRGFQDISAPRQPQLPPAYAQLLQTQAEKIWDLAPWEVLADREILAIEMNRWDTGTLYASVMGMLGVEYGILLYRSLDSLKKFRSCVLTEESLPRMETAFLEQDCFFLTFEDSADWEDEYSFGNLELDELTVNFGTIHPLEGMRPFLVTEEALVVYAALNALQKFCQSYREQLAAEILPSLKKTCRVTLPKWLAELDLSVNVDGIDAAHTTRGLSLASTTKSVGAPSAISLKVSTMPELSELFRTIEMAASEEVEEEEDFVLQDDLIPEDAFLSLGMMSWDNLAQLKWEGDIHEFSVVHSIEEGLPVVLVQTSRPKGQAIVDRLKLAGGLKGIAFNPGEDPFAGDRYDLGLLQTGNGNLFLFGEFKNNDPSRAMARHKWEQRCQNNRGKCALVVARGLKGSSRGNPQLKDIMAVFGAHSLSSQEMGLGLLQRLPQFDFD